jgi:hypothetical protein
MNQMNSIKAFNEMCLRECKTAKDIKIMCQGWKKCL